MDGALQLGLLAAAAAAVCYDTGYALQAIEVRRIDARHALRASMFGQLLRRPRWLAATALLVLGWPLQLVALGLAPLTLVQPVLALGLAWLLILGAWWLSEHAGPARIAATAAIVVGVAGMAWAAPERSDTHATGIELIVVLGVLGLVALAPYVVARLRGSAGVLLVLGAGAAEAWAAFGAKLVTDEASAGRWLVAVAWGIAAAGALGIGLISEMTALQSRRATAVAPVVLVMQIVIPVAFAPVVGGENWGDTPGGGLAIALALALVAGGAAVLATSRAAWVGSREGSAPPPTGARPALSPDS